MTADTLPLTYGQEQWLTTSLKANGKFIKKSNATFRVRGPLEVDRFVKAIDLAIRQVDAARLQIVRLDDETFEQVDCGKGLEPGMLVLQQLSGHPDEQQFREYVGKWLTNETLAEWDPFEGRMLKVGLFRHTPDEHAVVLLVSHLAFDGRSVHLMASKMFTIYDQLMAGDAPEQKPQFLPTLVRYRKRNERRATTTNVAYWDAAFSAETFNSALGEVQRSSESSRPAVFHFDVRGDSFRAVRDEAEAHGVTDCQWLLWRVQESVADTLDVRGGVFVLPMDYREPKDRDVIGMFTATTPFILPPYTNCTPKHVQAALLKSLFHGIVDPWKMKEVTSRLKQRTGFDFSRSIHVTFNHMERDVVNPVTSASVDLEPSYYRIPDLSFTSDLLEIELNTYDDHYTFICYHDQNRVPASVLQGLADDIEAVGSAARTG